MSDGALSLDELADALQQSKSNVSINIRGLAEWHLVRRRSVPGSRRDHYEAATDFFRAMQEIFERRFRWTVRQVLTAVEETRHTAESGKRRAGSKPHAPPALVRQRLDGLGRFFSLIDSGIGAFVRGEPFPSNELAAGTVLPANLAKLRTVPKPGRRD